jgi:hypothetical protein
VFDLRPSRCLGTVAFLVSMPALAEAASVSPFPTLVHLEQGYGIVAAVVESATAVSAAEGRSGQDLYDICFKVHMLMAQTIAGNLLPLKADSTIKLRIAVGYGCELEAQDPVTGWTKKGGSLAAGAKHLLTVKYDRATKSYEHAQGAGAARHVKEFTAEDKALYGKLRAFAALPLGGKLERTRELIAEANADPTLRGAVLAWISWRASHRDNTVDLGLAEIGEDDFNKVAKVLLALWHKPTGTHSLAFLSSLGYRIGEIRPEFSDSVEERDVWLAYLFAPIRASNDDKFREAVRDRSKWGISMLYGRRWRTDWW